MKHLTRPIRTFLFLALSFLMMIGFEASAATNAETIQYIVDKHEAECVAEQYEVRNAKEGEIPEVTVELKLDDDNIYEITIGSDGKTATVLHAEFSCTGIGYFWCGNSGCKSYVIVDGVSHTAWGWKPVSVEIDGSYLVLVPRNGSACRNSSETSLWGGSPCFTAAAWDDELKTFNSPSSSELVLTVSDFEP